MFDEYPDKLGVLQIVLWSGQKKEMDAFYFPSLYHCRKCSSLFCNYILCIINLKLFINKSYMKIRSATFANYVPFYVQGNAVTGIYYGQWGMAEDRDIDYVKEMYPLTFSRISP